MSVNGSLGRANARRVGARHGVAARLALVASLALALSATPVAAAGSAAASTDVAVAASPVDTDLLQAITRQRLTDPRPEGYSQFGSGVAVDGDTAVVGAWLASPHANNSGIAYVYKRTADRWVEQARLTPSNPQRADRFGWSVDIDGDTIIVGAENGGRLDENGGAAYVFVRAGSIWTQQAVLESAVPPGGTAYQFGGAVAIDGDVAVVGDKEEYVPEVGGYSGAAYVFERSGGVWTQRARLIDRDSGGWTWMGASVSVDDGVVVVGQPEAKNGTGRAWTYTKAASGWKQDALLTAPDGPGLNFGADVDLAGGTLVVGQGVGSRETNWGGAAFVYERDGASWAWQARLQARDNSVGDAFGASVAVYGDTIAVGAPGDGGADDDEDANKGAAYVFVRAGDTWTQRVKLAQEDAESDAQLGDEVALGPNDLLIGAPEKSTAKGENAGVVWSYSGLAG